MNKKRKTYSKDFKTKLINEYLNGKNTIEEIARKYDVPHNYLKKWYYEYNFGYHSDIQWNFQEWLDSINEKYNQISSNSYIECDISEFAKYMKDKFLILPKSTNYGEWEDYFITIFNRINLIYNRINKINIPIEADYVVKILSYSPDYKVKNQYIVAFAKILIRKDTFNKLLYILDKWYCSFDGNYIFKEFLNSLNEKEEKNLLSFIIKSNQNEFLSIKYIIILWFESKQILKSYNDYLYNKPEVTEAKNYFYKAKFFKYVEKIIKQHKPMLALYILNEYAASINFSDYILIINLYIKALISLDKIDILKKYYNNIKLGNKDIEFLQFLTEYYLKVKDIENAKLIIEQISKIEPTFPFIEKANNEIRKISMVRKLLLDNIDIENINNLTGKEFEELLISKFQELGFKAIDTPLSGDYGADIIIETKNETRIIVQCKRFKNKVNLKAVQEVVSAIAHYSGDMGIVITNSTFLNSAKKLAESNDIELWDNYKLMQFLSGDISFSEINEL